MTQSPGGFGPPPSGAPVDPALVVAPPVGAPAPARGRPRAWVLIGGGWMALCWFLLIGSALTADIGGVLLALIAMLPVQLRWRWRYWRTKQTPYYGATYTMKWEAAELHPHDEYELSVRDPEAYSDYLAARKLDGETYEVADHLQRGLGSFIAGYFLPMRDAVAEWRWSRGKGRRARI